MQALKRNALDFRIHYESEDRSKKIKQGHVSAAFWQAHHGRRFKSGGLKSKVILINRLEYTKSCHSRSQLLSNEMRFAQRSTSLCGASNKTQKVTPRGTSCPSYSTSVTFGRETTFMRGHSIASSNFPVMRTFYHTPLTTEPFVSHLSSVASAYQLYYAVSFPGFVFAL